MLYVNSFHSRFYYFCIIDCTAIKTMRFPIFSDMGRWIRMTIRWAIIITSFFQYGFAAGILAFLLCNKYAAMALVAFIYGFKQG